MKVVLTASRHPELDRAAFFRHLREVHWPLVRRYPSVLGQILRYTQNHSFLPEEDGGVPTPWRRAAERDSVIEVWFENLEALQRMDADPNYVAHVRPDEAAFNDLPNNVLLISHEEVFHAVASPGRLRRFDFLHPAPGCARERFVEECRCACAELALDPIYQALADGLSLHLPCLEGAWDPAEVQAVLATASSGLEPLARLAAPHFSRPFAEVINDERSFSVLATAFPMHPAPGALELARQSATGRMR